MKKLKIERHELEYNSQKEGLLYPEYGRNIQAMIELAKSEGDLDKRQLMVEAIVNLMYQMNPQSKNVDDYKEKLWKHVFHISNYNLGGVLPPSGIHPTPEDVVKRPERIKYPASGARYRHYGNNLHELISRALAMEDPDMRAGMVNTIGAYMKLAYRTWNREHYVSDDIIKADLESLSNGQLRLDEDVAIDKLAAANKRRLPNERNLGSNRNNDNRSGDNRNNNYRTNSDNRSGDNRNSNYRTNNDNRNNDNRGGMNNNNRNNDNRGGMNNNNRNNDNRGGMSNNSRRK